MASPNSVEGIKEYDEVEEYIDYASTEDPLSWTAYYENQNYFYNISYGDSRFEEITNNPSLKSAPSLRIRVGGMNLLERKYPLRWGILTERSVKRSNYRTAQEVPLDYWEVDWIMSLDSCYVMFAANHMLMPHQGRYSIPTHTRMPFSCPCGVAAAKWRKDRERRAGFPGLDKLGVPQCGENGSEDTFPSMRRLMMHLFRNRRDCFHEAAYCYMSIMYGGVRRFDYLGGQLLDPQSPESKEYLYWYNMRNQKRLDKIYGIPK